MNSISDNLARDGLTLMNYKEPLKAVPKSVGVGYYGAIICAKDGTSIQCHMCGGLFESLTNHLKYTHKISSRDYKIKYQLALQTALISENYRKEQKVSYHKWWDNLSKIEQADMRKRQIDALRIATYKRGSYQPQISLETKNKRGTCPDQLLDKIQKVADKLGHTPALKEFVAECGTQRYKHLIFTTFGSWENALKMLHMKPKERVNGNPSKSTLNGKPTYETEELLEYLRMFAEEENKAPTMTDFYRGYLPSFEVYVRRFGGIERARQAAGIADILDRKKAQL